MLCKNRGLLTVINHYYPLREYVMRRVAGAASKLVLSWHFILCNGTCFKILYNLDDSTVYTSSFVIEHQAHVIEDLY